MVIRLGFVGAVVGERRAGWVVRRSATAGVGGGSKEGKRNSRERVRERQVSHETLVRSHITYSVALVVRVWHW